MIYRNLASHFMLRRRVTARNLKFHKVARLIHATRRESAAKLPFAAAVGRVYSPTRAPEQYAGSPNVVSGTSMALAIETSRFC